IACQLLAAGEQVPFLALVESYAPVDHKRVSWLRLKLATSSFRIKWNIAEFRKVLSGEISLTRFLTYRQTLQKAARFIMPLRSAMPKTVEANFELWIMSEYL